MTESPTAKNVWRFTIALGAVAAATAVAASVLFPAHTRAQGTGGALPDEALLSSLEPDSSIFLLTDLAFPSDGLQTLVRENGVIRRVDLFQDGRRVAQAKVDAQRPYCAILTRLPGGSFVERIKRLQVANVESLPDGVRIHVTSFQESAIEELRCMGVGGPLTISSLRASLGQAGGDGRVTLLAPPGQAPATEVAKKDEPRPMIYREALLARSPAQKEDGPVLQNLMDAHRAYIRYLNTLQPLTAPGP